MAAVPSVAASTENGNSTNPRCVMSALRDLTGERFGYLTVICRVPNTKCKYARWRVRCRCGTLKIISSISLVRGRARSCGCFRRESSRQRASGKPGPLSQAWRHGFNTSNCPTYTSWVWMRQRCFNPRCREFKWYGGANPPVKICARWRGRGTGFLNFLADLGPRPKGTTLGRFGDVGDYTPSNCAWMTPAQHGAERRKKIALRKAA